MQKKTLGMKKLVLNKETLRALRSSELARVGGGNEPGDTQNYRFTGNPCIVIYCA